MIVKLVQHAPRASIPDLLRTITTCCRDELTIGRERYRIDRLADFTQVSEPLALRDSPDRSIAFRRASCEPRAGGVEGERSNVRPGECESLRPRPGVEHAYVVAAARREPAAIGAEC